jgi:toxin YoeB
MARQIIWTLSAHDERIKILEYWVRRNKSKVFSKKLNKLIVTAIKEVSKNPSIGRKTDFANVRVKIVREYLIFYEVTPKAIYILSI